MFIVPEIWSKLIRKLVEMKMYLPVIIGRRMAYKGATAFVCGSKKPQSRGTLKTNYIYYGLRLPGLNEMYAELSSMCIVCREGESRRKSIVKDIPGK